MRKYPTVQAGLTGRIPDERQRGLRENDGQEEEQRTEGGGGDDRPVDHAGEGQGQKDAHREGREAQQGPWRGPRENSRLVSIYAKPFRRWTVASEVLVAYRQAIRTGRGATTRIRRPKNAED